MCIFCVMVPLCSTVQHQDHYQLLTNCFHAVDNGPLEAKILCTLQVTPIAKHSNLKNSQSITKFSQIHKFCTPWVFASYLTHTYTSHTYYSLLHTCLSLNIS